MPLFDPINGLYRAGFALNQASFGANNTALVLSAATSSGGIALTVPQMLDAATLTYQIQIVTDTASKTFTAVVSKNGNAFANYSLNTAIGGATPPNSFVVVDLAVPLNGVAFGGDIFTLNISEPGIAGGNSTTFSISLSIAGTPI